MAKSMRAKDLSLLSIFPDIPRVKRIVTSTPDSSYTGENGVDFWIWFRALQGLVNREEPHLYLLSSGGKSTVENHWLDVFCSDHGVKLEGSITPDEALERYKDCVTGYVIYDDKDIIQTQNIAITLCGLEGTLPIAPSQEKYMLSHGIKKVDDLRGRFKDDWDAAEWAIENLWPRCNRRMYANFCIHRPMGYSMGHGLLDYVVYNRVFALDLPRSRVFRRSLNLFRKMMETAQAPGVQLCWHCIWDQEKEYVATAGECGFFSLCSTSAPNMTIQGGVGDREKSYSQPLPPAESCRAEKNKVYVCLYNSDGDAVWAMHNLHSENWIDPDRGAFPFGWGFLPLTVKMMPAVIEYYHKTKKENDCFWGPSSGAGYTYSWIWPEDLAEGYLKDSRVLLDRTGQNGCNMVNWFLQDYWREVENDAAVEREVKILSPGAPGLVCGLGGSPYATSYPKGTIPKLHSVHIADVKRDNIDEIIKLSQECATRPLFLFLFAQIAPGIFKKLNSEMEKLSEHPEIEILSMDQFFLTLQDAVKRGMVGDELYEKSEALAETWLKAPGRHRLPLYVSLTEELNSAAHDTPEKRRLRLGESGYTQLVSGEIEGIAPTREKFIKYFEGRTPPTREQEADALFYSLFTVAWGVVRSALEAKGIYANGRYQCLDDFRCTCCDLTDITPFDELWAAWDDWENGTPALERSIYWCERVAAAAKELSDCLGQKGEFSGWPTKAI
jgi:hypothetical protein